MIKLLRILRRFSCLQSNSIPSAKRNAFFGRRTNGSTTYVQKGYGSSPQLNM